MEKLPNLKLINGLLSAAHKYQNAGKGHVFIRISGHVKLIDLDVYVGNWNIGKEPEIKRNIYTEKGIKEAIDAIQELYNNTPDMAEIEAKQKEAQLKREREEYEKLKAKFEPTTL